MDYYQLHAPAIEEGLRRNRGKKEEKDEEHGEVGGGRACGRNAVFSILRVCLYPKSSKGKKISKNQKLKKKKLKEESLCSKHRRKTA